jgi:hypothetical protein
MFTGEVTWENGQAAPEVLEAYLEAGAADPQLPAMPVGLAEVLRKCFQSNPAERWASMAEAGDALRRVYREAVGKDHPRNAPADPTRDGQAAITHDRRMPNGVRWRDPREWLREAFEADGREPSEVEALLRERTGSRKARAIGDLAAYEEARQVFQRLVAGGRTDLEPRLANLFPGPDLRPGHLHGVCGRNPGGPESLRRTVPGRVPVRGVLPQDRDFSAQ